jgi:hypothetical protein
MQESYFYMLSDPRESCYLLKQETARSSMTEYITYINAMLDNSLLW